MSFNALFTKRIKNMKTKLVSIKNDSDDTKNWSKVLTKEDKYKFAVKVLLDNSFMVQSGEVFYKVGFSYMVLRKKV